MVRNRPQTQQRLLAAVHQLLTAEGLDQVRINRVASLASVNKVLIYRYFGGIDGLLGAYYEQYRPFVAAPPINLAALAGAPLSEFFQACSEYILAEFRLLRANPQAQQVLRNELMGCQTTDQNPVAAQKQAQLEQMVAELGKLINSTYGASFSTVILSAMTLLTFMAQDKRTIMGIALDTDEGWAEIELAIKRIFYGIYLATKERIGDTVPAATLL